MDCGEDVLGETAKRAEDLVMSSSSRHHYSTHTTQTGGSTHSLHETTPGRLLLPDFLTGCRAVVRVWWWVCSRLGCGPTTC